MFDPSDWSTASPLNGISVRGLPEFMPISQFTTAVAERCMALIVAAARDGACFRELQRAQERGRMLVPNLKLKTVMSCLFMMTNAVVAIAWSVKQDEAIKVIFIRNVSRTS